MGDIKRLDILQNASVNIYQTDRFKTESLSVYFSMPASKSESVIRTLLLSTLKRGTKSYPSQKEINKRLDELYATIVSLENQSVGNTQLFGFSIDVVKNEYIDCEEDIFRSAIDVLSEMLFSPFIDGKTDCFLEDYVSSEKQNYKNTILSSMNEPRSYASLRCREETLASLDLSYKLSEIFSEIDKIDARTLTDYYKKMIMGASFEVFYVGNRDACEIEKYMKVILPECKTVAERGKAEVKTLERVAAPSYVTEEKDISQGRLALGVNCGVTWRDSDYLSMLVCNEILGASPISKLMMNVREAKSLCYECSSVYNSARGVLFINSGIDVESYDVAREAIIEQIDDMASGKISESELFAAKNSLINVYRGIYDSPDAIERFYLGRIVCKIDTSIDDMLEGFKKMKMADVVSTAKKLCVHTVYFLKGDSCGEVDYDEE